MGLSYIGAAFNVSPLPTIDGQLFKLDIRDSGNDSAQAVPRGISAAPQAVSVIEPPRHGS